MCVCVCVCVCAWLGEGDIVESKEIPSSHPFFWLSICFSPNFQIHLIDFDDESNVVNKNVFLHSVGEIW